MNGKTKKTVSRLLKGLVAVTCISTLICCAGAVSAFEDVDEYSDYTDSVEYVNSHSIMVGDDKGNFNPNKTVSRAEMATIICRMLNESSLNVSSQFSDVPQNYWANGYIAKAAELGIVNGYGNGIFKPYNDVTYEQAITMIVRALGGESLAQQAGGYPKGFISLAKECGLGNGVQGEVNEAISRGDVSLILYNSDGFNFSNGKPKPNTHPSPEKNPSDITATENGNWKVSIPARYKIPYYAGENATSAIGYLKAQNTPYSITSTKKATLSNGLTRYYVNDGQYWITASHNMSVSAQKPQTEPPTQITDKNTFYVNNANELTAALGSDRKIILADGTYNVKCLWLRDVENLTIEGSGNARIVAEDGDSGVIDGERCKNLTLNNLYLGHDPLKTKATGCSQAVLRLAEVSGTIQLNNCELFGCGISGIICYKNEDHCELIAKDCTIRDCSESIASISSDIAEFHNCKFLRNGYMVPKDADLANRSAFVTGWKTSGLFDGCIFENNLNNYFFLDDSSRFKENNCTYKGNAWE